MGRSFKKIIFEKKFSFIEFGSEVEVMCNKEKLNSSKDKHSCNVALYASINQKSFMVA